MANRRLGGHNRSFSVNSMSVNPWQGGAPPSVGSISQLTDTQAQLALALTNLLRSPSVASGGQQQLPSLLNLPHVNPVPYDYQRHNYDYDRNDRSMNNRRSRYNDKMQNRRSRDRRRKEQKSDGQKDDSKQTKDSLSKTKDSDSRNDSDVNKTESENVENSKEDGNDENETGGENNENTDGNENGVGEKKDDDNKDGENKEKTKRNKDGKYAGIPVQYLKCLICEKSMWDGESFEKHLRGRAHQQMCESLEESYKVQADMMRQTIRLAEERKMIELNRMKRHGKHVDMRKVTHCNMCSFDFYGRESEHRRSEGHQKLKRFLHPRCKRCRVEFPTKIEWEEHRLTPDHIRKTMEQKEAGDNNTIELDSGDEVLDLTLDGDDYEEEDHDPDNVILEIVDNLDLLTNFENRIPVYKKSRSVGINSISEVTGHLCKICNQFFLNENKMQNHTKSRIHYNNFVKLLKNKHTEKVKLDEEENKSKKHNIDDEVIEDNEGNWKRRKISSEDDGNNSQINTTSNSELYDPMEAEEEEERANQVNEIKQELHEQVEQGNNHDKNTSNEQLKQELDQQMYVENVKTAELESPVKEETENIPRATRNRGKPRIGPLSKTRGRNN